MNALITILITSLATAGVILLSQGQLTDIQVRGHAQTALIGGLNHRGTLNAATIKWQLDTLNTTVPTPEELVAAGYLAPEFLAEH